MWWNVPVLANQPGLADALLEARNKKRLGIVLVVVVTVVVFFFLKRKK